MSGAMQKIPLFESANKMAQNRVNDAIQLTGRALPCRVVSVSNSIVTVKFEINTGFTLPNVTIPMFGGEYIRYPTQVGDKGVVLPFDARLSGVSGIGGGTADLSQPANLTALVFLPISNTAWSAVDENALTLYGPNGVVLRDTATNSFIVLTPTGILATGAETMSITSGTASMTVNNDGSWSVSGAGSAAISAGQALTITAGPQSTSLPQMHDAWNVLVDWLNSHTHPDPQGGTTSPPSSPFTGENIVT